MRRPWFRLQYKHRIAAATFLIVVVPLSAICLMYMGKLYQEQQEQALAGYRENLGVAADRYRTRMDALASKLAFVNISPEIIAFLSDEEPHGLDAIFAFNWSLRPVFDALKADDASMSLTVYSDRPDVIGSGDILKRSADLLDGIAPADGDLAEQLLALPDGGILWRYRVLPPPNRQGTEPVGQLCAYKRFTGLARSFAVTELRFLFVNIERMIDFELPEGSFVGLLLDGSSPPLLLRCAPGAEEAARETAAAYFRNGAAEGFETIESSEGPRSHRIVLFLPESYAKAWLPRFLTLSVLFFFGLLLVILAIAELVSGLLTRRLSGLLNRTSLDLEKQLERPGPELEDTGDEFTQLNIRFLALVGRIREYYARVAGYEKEKRELELDLLQARINPHFLYNTLDTIRWVSKEPKIDAVIESLVRYYRIALNKGSNVLRIGQELEMVEEYLKLEQFTFDAKFRYRIDVGDDVRECLIIKNLLQPVVENAVLHGVSSRDEDGLIEIRGACEDGRIRLTVSDNGNGIETEKAERILRGESLHTMGGYGLGNVIRRIEMQYGPPYGLQFDSRPGEGTVVTILLPILREEPPHDPT